MSAISELLQAPRAAVAFLTRLPVDRRGDLDASVVASGLIYFPLVGALIGGLTAAVAGSLARVFPAGIAAIGAVAAGAVLTGALHLDGLADTADGYGASSRERALAIMRDHSLGSYGVIALFVDLAMKTAATANLVVRPGGLLYFVAAGALSRAAMVAIGVLVPYARAEDGLGKLLIGASPWLALWVAVLGIAVAALAIRLNGLVVVPAVGLVALLWAWHCRRRLGGVTGDTLGAASEGCEVLVLLLGVALMLAR